MITQKDSSYSVLGIIFAILFLNSTSFSCALTFPVSEDSVKRSTMLTMLAYMSGSEATPTPTVGDGGFIFISNLAETSLTLNWTEASSTTTDQLSLSYSAYYSTNDNLNSVTDIESNGTELGLLNSGTTSLAVTSLNADTKYYFNLIVSDPEGNKSAYAAISESTITNLVFYYPFQGGKDLSNNSYDAVVTNGTTVADNQGNAGYGYHFDGATISNLSRAYVSNATNNVSFSLWIKWAGDTASSQNILMDGHGWGGGFVLHLRDDAQLHRLTVLCGGVGYANSNYTPPLNTWAHIAGVKGAGAWQFYADGLPVAMTSDCGMVANSNATQNMTIGSGTGGTVIFNGDITNVRFYSKALTATQVTDLYNSQK